jgi:hypothetical protein
MQKTPFSFLPSAFDSGIAKVRKPAVTPFFRSPLQLLVQAVLQVRRLGQGSETRDNTP